jgi:trk system potassium uptake protein
MGMAYLAITLIRRFSVTKGNIINAEAETPNLVEFENESEASESGFDFLKIYTLLTLVLFVLLVISGVYFGSKGYEKWYDNIFDAWIHTLGTMGTGGFSNYNSSVGLPITVDGVTMAGGLQNKVSEWIIGIFMMFAGSNLSLWYILVFKFKNWRNVFKSRELQVYLSVVGFLSLVIATSLYFDKSGSNFFDSLRYAFFNVNTVMSTTGFGTADFTKWPPIAQGLLFVCYLVGGMVGSTSGGLKLSRFMVLFRLSVAEIRGLITGKFSSHFTLDGVKYDLRSATLVVINMVLYYILFLVGGILILASSSVVTYVDKSTSSVDFTSAFTASIATLGNIGPAIAVGAVDAGPNGNYFAYSESAKLIMTLLMFVGRVGILTFVVIFMSNLGQKNIEASIPEIEFEEDKPALRA